MIAPVAPISLEPRAADTGTIATTGGGGVGVLTPGAPTFNGASGFVDALGRALDSVNALQQQADATKVAIASGEPVDMSQAVVGIERANVAFQLTLQIRNKLLEAYQEVMRMQV